MAKQAQTPDSEARAKRPPSRWRWVRRIAIGLGALLFAVLGAVSLWLSNIASATYDHDILTLVPADMALTLELRRLGERSGGSTVLDDLVEQLEVLVGDPAYDRAMRTGLAGRLFGTDAAGKPARPEALVRRLLEQVDAANKSLQDNAGPLLDLMGPLNVRRDLLGGEAVVAVRPVPGQSPRLDVIGATETPGARGVLVYPDREFLVLVRVSGKIKVAVSQLGRLAGFMGHSGVTIEPAPSGAWSITPAAAADAAAPTTLFVLLVGDVLAVTPSADLMDLVAALADGSSDEHIFGSPLFRRTVDLVREDAKSAKETAERLSAPIRAFLNVDRVRWMMRWDALLDIPDLKRTRDEVSMSSYLLIEDSVRAALEMRHVQASLLLLDLSPGALGTLLTADAYVALHEGRLPEHLRQSYLAAPEPSGVLQFASARTMAVLAMRKDVKLLKAHLDALAAERGGGGLPAEFFGPLLEYLGDDLGVLIAPQMLVPPADPLAPLPKVLPLFCIALELNEVGRSLGAQLAERPFTALLGKGGRVGFEDLTEGKVQIKRLVVRDSEGLPSPALAHSIFGPEADPAAAIAGNFLLISTNLDYLREIVRTADAKQGRYRKDAAGPSGVLEGAFDRRSLALGRFDLTRFVGEFLTDSTIDLMVKTQFPPRAEDNDPVRQMRNRRLARQRYPGDAIRRDAEYERLEREYFTNVRDAEERLFRERRTDFARFVALGNQAGVQLLPLARADAYRVQLALGLGTLPAAP